jgi:hypothetical protein
MKKRDFLRHLGVTLLAAPTLMRTSVAADNRAGTQSGERKRLNCSLCRVPHPQY